jgi:hypothetical protein
VSTALLEHVRAVRVSDGSITGALHPVSANSSGGLTLDDLVTSVWEGLAAFETARCPACGGAMAPHHIAGRGVVGGFCKECSSQLI